MTSKFTKIEKCIVKGCEKEAFDKDGYCKKCGWARIVDTYFETEESRLMFPLGGKFKDILKDTTKEMVK
jgi:hypothetical protein